MLKRIIVLVVVALTAALVPASAQTPQKRVALIIANGAYVGQPVLDNPQTDAALLKPALERSGFRVTVAANLDRNRFNDALVAFTREARDAQVAMIYFAGHGLAESGQNWLLPVDFDADDLNPDADNLGLDLMAKSHRNLIQAMSTAQIKILVLDACRNNPFASRIPVRGGGTRSADAGAAGLADIEDRRAVIVMSAEAGRLANDGARGEGSPFARAFADGVDDEGVELSLVFRRIADTVARTTAQQRNPQRPKIVGIENLGAQEVFLRGAPAPAAAVDRSELPPPPAPKTRPGETFKECDVCPEMVVIPAGSFLMGSPETEVRRRSDEGPQRQVAIAQPFAVGKFEVTFAQWDACVAAGGCAPPEEGPYSPPDEGWGRDNRPVINVSWQDAKRYVRWLNGRIGGKAYRLLTEAEWEYAARAGTSTRWSFGDDEARLGDFAWFVSNSGPRAQPVGGKAGNPWGLFDMHGNVWEWVEDCYNNSLANTPTNGAANTTLGCSYRVFRGGGWNYSAQILRSAIRFRSTPTIRDVSLGFRVARTL